MYFACWRFGDEAIVLFHYKTSDVDHFLFAAFDSLPLENLFCVASEITINIHHNQNKCINLIKVVFIGKFYKYNTKKEK